MAVFTATEALEMAMEIEKNGEVFYNEAAAKSTDSEVKALFEDLAIQEQGHYRTFKKMLGGAQPAPELLAPEYDQYEAYVLVALENGPQTAYVLNQALFSQLSAMDHFLAISEVLAHLEWLEERGAVTSQRQDGRVTWHKRPQEWSSRC